MAKNNKHQKVSPQTQEEATKVAKATQRPGQTKEQTKLIAQGIQKGIDHYKKLQKAKSRELNKKLQKVSQSSASSDHNNATTVQVDTIYRQSVIPWVLLILSWVGFAAVFYLKGNL